MTDNRTNSESKIRQNDAKPFAYSEAQVEAAARAIWERYAGHGLWETLPAARKAPFLKDARAALVAAQGAATEEAFKKAGAFDKAVALSERRQTLLEEAEAERDAALARIAAAAELHQPEPFHDEPTESFCKMCQRTAGLWPCRTAIALGLNGGENNE